jgi:DNA-binding NtrC family response regulator
VGEDAESEVNRNVDRKLKFVTRSLVAVPMKSATGQLVGVFEVINKNMGGDDEHGATGFGARDIARLVDLARHATTALLGAQTRQRLTQSRDRLLSDAASSYQVIGQSPAIRSLRETIARVAPTELSVLALGENGTGKEVIARSLHFQSQRRDQAFVAVNCAALVESLLESELFGHERGAFTDAHQARPGKFELANGGTLFLDEIGDMSPGGQAKLLRVLEEKIVVRVGGSTPIPVDVRIIAATNQSLPELVAQKRFREDLFFRLNVVSFRLPPLRQRGDDILLLADHFLQQFAAQIGRAQPSFSDAAKEAMLAHPWPGNVRELRNVMERASYLAQSNVLSPSDLGLGPIDSPTSGFTEAGGDIFSAGLQASAGPTASSGDGVATGAIFSAFRGTLADATHDFQVELIRASIQAQRGNMTAAAETLGLHRSNLYRKMRQLGMNVHSLDNE